MRNPSIKQSEQNRDIAIVIDTWDDIFSDFDPRPLNERTLSGDFIDELRKRYKETRTGNYIITIHAPLSLKDEKSERMVIRRLKQHFRQKFLEKKKLLAFIRIRGAIFAAIGVCSLSFLTLATYFKFLHALAIQMLGILLMPLGWFGLWEGFSKIVDTSPIVVDSAKLFEKLSDAKYDFKYIVETQTIPAINPAESHGSI
jgi:hypothetical protein